MTMMQSVMMQSVVSAVNKHHTREQNAMHLLGCLWFFIAQFDIDVKCRHITGLNNHTADYLSCDNLCVHSFTQRTCPPDSCLPQLKTVGASSLIMMLRLAHSGGHAH